MKVFREFGIGNDDTEYYWNSLIRQMLLGDLLVKDIEEYGVLKITKKGQEFLKKPQIVSRSYSTMPLKKQMRKTMKNLPKPFLPPPPAMRSCSKC